MKMTYAERHAEERKIRAEQAKEFRDRVNAGLRSKMGEKDYARFRELSREIMFARRAKAYEKYEALTKEYNDLMMKYGLN